MNMPTIREKMEIFFTTEDAAFELGVDPRMIRYYVKLGVIFANDIIIKLKFVKNRSYKFKGQWLNDFLEAKEEAKNIEELRNLEVIIEQRKLCGNEC